jgi:predicted amidophosphoribosyltransferase
MFLNFRSQFYGSLQRIIQASRHCCVCGALRVRSGTLCDRCRGICDLMTVGNEAPRRYCGKMPVFALYKWPISGQGEVLGEWLRSLKGGVPACEFSNAAQSMALAWQSHYLRSLDSLPCLIPIPPHFPGAIDHAVQLAKALHDWTGWPMASLLTRVSMSKSKRRFQRQKALSRSQRQNVVFEASEESFFLKGPFIIVDDIVTTGATVRAAYRALGSPAHTRVWALADRQAPLGLQGRMQSWPKN